MIFAAIATFARAQAPEPRHEFELLAGYSPQSTVVIGTAQDRKFVLAGLAYTYRLLTRDRVSLGYTAGVFPAAIVVQPRQTSVLTAVPGVVRTRVLPPHSVYGFAVAPVGITAELAPRRRVHPILDLLGGVVASTEPVPDYQPNATGLNFLFDLGAGLRWRTGAAHAITIGYKFLHISNAGSTSFNPGVDNHVIYAAFSIFR